MKMFVSPAKSPSQQGNLTGIPRKVKDLCVDWHNQHLKWTELSKRGFQIVENIANIKLQSLFAQEDTASDGQRSEIGVPMELVVPVDSLLSIIQGLECIVRKMSAITASLCGIYRLELHQHNESQHNLEQDPLFISWSADKFYKSAAELVEMYESEFRLRKTLYGNIAHAQNRDLLMVHTAIWLHQPYIKEKASFLLELMLRETGLKD